ncbi:dihydrofolate synthetase Fol3 [Lepidopterella palustris CBS 459.81]|uniref:Dihydrofolate synthetase n=1 Tax=Lepidopterella palustris CBS 459.81 TaxID=1314670 RepID=A0A8E2EDH3_9PEZI|nr:dihydrofolate synthetase Fol3 [Lepidopterella palustris CBS 459.81]
MIQPGLERISLLLKHTPLSWKAIHVAGTNGKGSICASISAMLHRENVRCGRFTSPHLIDRWDCISINEAPVKHELFREVEKKVLSYNAQEGINASEFELLTATAFEIFNRENVKVGVVEVGMGGRLDATNVLQSPLVTVISKIGLDHQSWLGDSIEKIAREKAGILKPGVPCVVDHTNELAVNEVIETVAKEVGAGPLLYFDQLDGRIEASPYWREIAPHLALHQQANTACALVAARQCLEILQRPKPRTTNLLSASQKAVWPGRLQTLKFEEIDNGEGEILLDGAHNADSARVLGQYVDEKLRHKWAIQHKSAEVITWVLAMSEGKAVNDILKPLLRPWDNVVTVEFGPVEGMPWVKPMPASRLLEHALRVAPLISHRHHALNVAEALLSAKKYAQGRPIVIAGSLYLVGDVLRLKRDGMTDEGHHKTLHFNRESPTESRGS